LKQPAVRCRWRQRPHCHPTSDAPQPTVSSALLRQQHHRPGLGPNQEVKGTHLRWWIPERHSGLARRRPTRAVSMRQSALGGFGTWGPSPPVAVSKTLFEMISAARPRSPEPVERGHAILRGARHLLSGAVVYPSSTPSRFNSIESPLAIKLVAFRGGPNS
jgi:hypothetical protein